VNAGDEYGWTALIDATIKGHVGMVRLLIGNGSGRDVKDADGRAALDRAKERGSNETVEILTEW